MIPIIFAMHKTSKVLAAITPKKKTLILKIATPTMIYCVPKP
jgi:hypothetical protein